LILRRPTPETVEQSGIRTDYDREIGTFGSSHPACRPREIRLGDAVAKDVYCYTNPNRSRRNGAD